MSLLKDILKESKEHYQEVKAKIDKKLAVLPRGSIKERVISGEMYYYLQYREGNQVKQKYLGKDKPDKLVKQLKERRLLKSELKKIKEALKVLKRAEGRKRKNG